MLKTYKHTTALMSAAIVTGVSMGISKEALATGNTLDTYAQNISGNVNSVPNIVSFLCYLFGAGLAALGIVGLKQHVENPGNAPMKNGLAKLGFGGMLIAVPAITEVMLDTTNSGDEATFQQFDSGPANISG